jgi:dTDP-4-dehydrorhamnose reductase
MRFLVTGASGQLGRELLRRNWPEGVQVSFLSHQELDIGDPDAVSVKIRKPVDLVINTAAYTAVDQAEHEPELVYSVNADAAGLLASRCEALGIPLIHLSTDYVFAGSSRLPYTEADEASAVNIYGASKLAGEEAVRAALRSHVILRTASLFSEFGQNFVKSMLRLSAERPRLGVVIDQISCPTPAADVAAMIVAVSSRITSCESDQFWGTYHFCGQPPISWFHFAQRIFQVARGLGLESPELQPISATEYPGAAMRPAYSALDCSKIALTFGVKGPLWAAGLPDVISAIIKSKMIT